MSFKLLLIAGIVGGGFATTAALWLAGMAVDRVKQAAKRQLWVFATVMVTLVAGALATGTCYSIYVGSTYYGWFAQHVMIFGPGWEGWLVGLMLLVWGLAFMRGSGPVILVQQAPNYAPPVQDYGQQGVAKAQA
jgi:energy-coupling factor transporter transmembrane protein EcfT